MNDSFQILAHSDGFNIRLKSDACDCHLRITAIKLCKCTPLVRLDCWGWASRVIEPLWLISVNLIMVGVVSISPCCHTLFPSLPPSVPLFLFRSFALARQRLLRAAALFETKPQMGLFKAFRVPLNRGSYAKTRPRSALIQSPPCNYLHLPFRLSNNICNFRIPKMKGAKFASQWEKKSPICIQELQTREALCRQTLSYRESITVFMNRLVRCHQQRCYGNGRPRRRRLSPWKRCLT